MEKKTLSNKVYDVLKWCCMFALPGLAVLIKNVFPIWNIPYGNEISQTIVDVNAFLAICLGISCISYNQKQKENK